MDLRRLTYRPAASPGPIELLTFADLRRTDARLRRAPQRPDFHVLALVRSGAGRHRVDFTDDVLGPGGVVWIRPGQVNQWLDVDDVEGDLVLFTAGAVAFTVDGPSCWTLDGRDRELTRLAVRHLRAEYDADPAGPIPADLLTALLRRATRGHTGSGPVPDDPVRRLRAAVEDDLARGVRRTVREHAAALGWSVRTLDRAVVAASGVTAKTWLDDRTLLEARRLLAHTDLSAAACARHLGFPDAANFSAFFARRAGTTPGRWRHRATGP